jgi:hypothetical protein
MSTTNQENKEQTVPLQPVASNIEKVLAETGITKEQFDKLASILPKEAPAKDLELEKKIEEERRKAFQTAQNQLYPTIEKQREDLNKIKEMLEKKEKEQLELEAAKNKALEEEANKNRTFEEKLELLRQESTKAIHEISQTYETKLNSLQQTVYVKELSMIRKDLIAESGLADFSDFITDPAKNPNITVDQLKQEIEIAKSKRDIFAEKIRTEFEAKLKSESQTSGQSLPFGNPLVNNGNSNISNQPGSVVDLRKVATANKTELNKIKDELFAKFKFNA